MKKLHKSYSDKWIFGVCSGIAEYLDIDVTLIRLFWGGMVLMCGVGVLAYIFCAIVMPSDYLS